MAGLKSDGFGTPMPNRDEFGLPTKPSVSKGASPSPDLRDLLGLPVVHEDVVFDEIPQPASSMNNKGNPFGDKMKGPLSTDAAPADTNVHATPNKLPGHNNDSKVSWARVVKQDLPPVKSSSAPADAAGTSADMRQVPLSPISSGNPIATVEPIVPVPPAAAKMVNEHEWTEVKRKKQCSNSDMDSPSPPVTFKNLKKVDEIDGKHGHKNVTGNSSGRLTKSQKKKLRASQGSPPSSLS
ncbi:hypothetical protein ACET3Z_018282 [Daucus carota]